MDDNDDDDDLGFDVLIILTVCYLCCLDFVLFEFRYL